jgi:glycosyltransferase involved in cell wall biosynthesis
LLIINHVDYYSTYGAATSMRMHVNLLLSSNSGISNIYIINRVSFLKYLFGFFSNTKAHNQKVVLMNLWAIPFDNNYDGSSDISDKLFFNKISLFFRKIIYSILFWNSKRVIYNLIKKNNVDIVHLNSSVLVDLAECLRKKKSLNDRLIIIMHIRDFVSEKMSLEKVKKFNYVDTFICIDSATKNRFLYALKSLNIREEKIFVLQNLFEKSSSNKRLFFHESLFTDKIKFAIVGRVSELKGVLFVINSFISAGLKNAILYIIGSGEGEYFSEVIAKCRIYPNILVYHQGIKNISESTFYSDIDVIVRGDESFRTGRTVYEAIINGSKVIMPGVVDDLLNDIDLYHFKNEILLYNQNSQESLVDIFRRIEKSSLYLKKSDYSYIFKKNRINYLNTLMEIYSNK